MKQALDPGTTLKIVPKETTPKTIRPHKSILKTSIPKPTIVKTLLFLGSVLLAGNSLAIEHGCAASTQSLFLACGFDVKEGYLSGLAICGDTNNQAQAESCISDVVEEREEDSEECDEVFEARMALCEKLDDAAHEVGFGEAFSDNFVDPLEIGETIEPNPWLPLVQGNEWVTRHPAQMRMARKSRKRSW